MKNITACCLMVLLLAMLGCAIAAPAFSAPLDDGARHQAMLQEARRNSVAALSSPDFLRNATPEEVSYVLGNKSLAGMTFPQYSTISERTPLMLAAWYSPYPEVIAMLIKAGCDPLARQTDRDPRGIFAGHGYTALHFAAEHNPNPAVTDELLKYKLDVNTPTGFGQTPLYLACLGQDGRDGNPRRLETVRLLLSKGASPNSRDKDGQTPLIIAVCEGDLEKVQAMLPFSDLEIMGQGGDTALVNAFRLNHSAIATELLRAGAQVNQRDLRRICTNNSDELDMELLRAVLASQDVNQVDAKGVNPLLYAACYSGAYRVVEALFAAGAKLQGTSYLTTAMGDPSREYQQTLAVLLQHGDNPNAGQGAPLRVAAMQRKALSVELLLKAGADPNLQDARGNTALMTACWDEPGYSREGVVDVVQMLLKAGAKVNAVNHKGECALMVAVFRSYEPKYYPIVVDLLIKAGTELNVVYPCSHTPLTFIMQSEYNDELGPMRYIQRDLRLRYARLMLEAGADPNLANATGQTPIMLAEKYPEVKSLLLEAQNKPRPATPAGNRNNSQRR